MNPFHASEVADLCDEFDRFPSAVTHFPLTPGHEASLSIVTGRNRFIDIGFVLIRLSHGFHRYSGSQ